MILSNFYKAVQAFITQNSGDPYGTIKYVNGNEGYANIRQLYFQTTNLECMFLVTSLYGFSTIKGNQGFFLGSNADPVTIDDYTYGTLNSELSVTYLSDKSSIVHDIENHKVTVTRAWSITNTSTTLSVAVNELCYITNQNIMVYREILGDKAFTLQPLQAGTFTMTLEYNLVDYSSNALSSNFNIEL